MTIFKQKGGGTLYPLPVTTAEMHFRGWGEIDILIVTGDSYIDHPFMEAALVGRVLEREGFRVGVLPQPDWKTAEAFVALGRPRLFYLITAGNADSMAANYTPSRTRQKEDPYSIRGAVGLRPDRASIVYAHRAREAGRGVPVVLFGLEASLRRLAHFDYWDDRVRRPVLFDAKADMVLHGPPEKTAALLAKRIQAGERIGAIKDLFGTAFKQKKISGDFLQLPSCGEVSACRQSFLQSFSRHAENYFSASPQPVAQPVGDWYLVENPSPPPAEMETVDSFYELPYTRRPHPLYKGERIPIAPVLEETIVAVRGCPAPPAVCPSAFHFRSMMEVRSLDSIKKEAERIASEPGFSGQPSVVGGYAARKPGGLFDLEKETGGCWSLRKWPRKEGHLVSQLELREVLESVAGVEAVHFCGVYNPDSIVGGSWRTSFSGSPGAALPVKSELKNPSDFLFSFVSCCETRLVGKRSEPYLIPALVVGRPGVETADVVEMALFLRKRKLKADKVMEFLPVPLSLATARFFTGLDPLSGLPVYVPARTSERKVHRAILKHYEPENYERVRRALIAVRRRDLIGKGAEALIDFPSGTSAVAPGERGQERGNLRRSVTLRKGPQGRTGSNFPFRKRW
ncbi:MAG: DUF3362 domain-containing protein [candidate division Zixibacteria bacterium]|nr:DUF3362 domain-containing protein [candidate division Zixibacteria bacterium]